MKRNDPRKCYVAFPGTLNSRPLPAPAPAPLVRVHRVTKDGVQLHIETARPNEPTVVTNQERIDAISIRAVPRAMCWPSRSVATLA